MLYSLLPSVPPPNIAALPPDYLVDTQVSGTSENQIVDHVNNIKNNSDNNSFLCYPPETFVCEFSSFQKTENNLQFKNLGGKLHLSVGKQTISQTNKNQNNLNIPNIQNIIEFKPRDSKNQESIPKLIQPPVEIIPKPASDNTPISRQRIVEVVADRQEYDQVRRIVTAEGRVVVRFDGAIIDADRLQINLDNLIAVGEGNVSLTRGNQLLQGQRFTYDFIQDSGQLQNSKGELFLPTTGTDFSFSPTLPTDVSAGSIPTTSPQQNNRQNQPLSKVTSPGGIQFGVTGQSGATNIPIIPSGGQIKRIRFEANKVNFYPRGFEAEDVRITNDPFSPPELEIRARKVNVRREAPLIDRVTTQGQKLVFDQKLVIPIPINNRKIDRRQRQFDPLASVGYDNGERGGLYLQRSFETLNDDNKTLVITPQLYVQKALQGKGNFADFFGVNAKLNMAFSPKTILQGRGELTTFDFNQVENRFRGNLRLRQLLGDTNPYTLNLESSYRDLLYNGSLGYQTVQSSLGAVVTSPIIPLGSSGVNLSYQVGGQLINANTDRASLLNPVRQNNRVYLSRLQGSVALSSAINLWQGKSLPATSQEGLKYSPNSLVPNLQAIAGITGTTSYYSSGDNQSTLTGTIGLNGQFGNFSRSYLDYTAFNISYSQTTNSGLSPFLFDRFVDNKVLSFGLSQQLYGPVKLGLQTSINLDTGKETSTDYILEYSRRTYGITLRYNPVLELGSFTIRISDFNWVGGTDPFSDGIFKPVLGGVTQDK